MAQENRSRLSEWCDAVRAQIPVLREQIGEWIAAVREQPSLVWQAAAVRYAAYLLGGVLILWVTNGIVRTFAPVNQNAQPVATTGDFHVVCDDRSCAQHFVIHRPLGFSGFPVQCPKCSKQSGVSSIRCNSEQCQGRWIAPVEKPDGVYCPRCQVRLRE